MFGDMALLTERYRNGIAFYKHVAPPERNHAALFPFRHSRYNAPTLVIAPTTSPKSPFHWQFNCPHIVV